MASIEMIARGARRLSQTGRREKTQSERGFYGNGKLHIRMSSKWRTTTWASDRRSLTRCAVECLWGANVSEAVEDAPANLFGQSAQLHVFPSRAKKTFAEKLLVRPARCVCRSGIQSRIKKQRSFPPRCTFA
jgi:hypothetical protein